MKRIVVKMKDAKEKVYAPRSFFDAMHFGINSIELTYTKNYYFTKAEGNLMERHMTVLKSIPIKFCIELINEEEK